MDLCVHYKSVEKRRADAIKDDRTTDELYRKKNKEQNSAKD